MQKMADGVVLDLYGEDLDKEFGSQNPDGFSAEGVDLYDDIASAPPESSAVTPAAASVATNAGETPPGAGSGDVQPPGSNGISNNAPAPGNNHIGRRFQLYIGNLTWWTTDHDIANAMRDIGVNDFQEVKFFENRSNGQSKGFCVVSMGSETSLRTVFERFGSLELHGQTPAVTYPTKQALNQFESMQKTRPLPPPQQNGPVRGPAPQNLGGMGGPMSPHPTQQGVMPPGHPARLMNPNMPPGQYRPQNMQHGPPMGPNGGPARMQTPMHQGGAPLGGQQQMIRYQQNQNQWGGQPRSNGPRPGPPNMSPQQRPQMYQGPPGAMPMRGARPDWNRPAMHGGFPPQGPQGPPQGPPHMQGPPRCPPQMGGPGVQPGGPGGPLGPVPHVNPAFFGQPGGPPQHHGGMHGPPHGPPGPGPQPPPMNMPPQHGPPHFAQQGPGPRGPWPGPPQGKPQGPFPDQQMMPQMSEAEFEEVMGRNRTVSSSAIARAVSDAATGEYTSAIETLVTAISLIKQSKVAHDERCKILISSLQDTLHGIESKSYNRRERSRSRDRSHRNRSRRERSVSRYRERSRERDRDRETGYRERSRSRERERAAGDHYRDDSSSRSGRQRKSPEPSAETSSETTSKRSYYDERYRSSDRERERDRDRSDRERDRDRDRERDREHRSRH